MQYPYGRAPLAILLIAIVAIGAVLVMASRSGFEGDRKPDLVLATFAREHVDAYKTAIAQFEKIHNVKIQLQLVDQRALQSRLQAAMQVGADVPDMVELLDGTLGYFIKLPTEYVEFHDLTERVHREGLWDRTVNSRFGKWSSNGHIFALPHDVHPVMLTYRRDLVEQLGIDVNKLTTWDEFARVGREVVTKDLDGDGNPDRYMIDLPADGSDALRLMILQRGGGYFNAKGEVAFDDEATLGVVCWYVKQIQGKDRTARACGWGQNLAKSMIDGLCLFYFCPDWRTNSFQQDVPMLAGKLALMPLPAWKEGESRTSCWGGTGMAFPKSCRNFDLAWKLAMYLYYDADQLGPRFAQTNILPPLKDAWTRPEFFEQRPFWSNVALGQAFAQLAPQVPAEVVTAYTGDARAKLNEAFLNTSIYYQKHGDEGLRDYARAELKRCADAVRALVARNVFLRPETAGASK
jgi:arabinosaccharide transport system substrate-binding protein